MKRKLSIRKKINNYYFYKFSINELSTEALKINLTTRTHRNSGDNDLNIPAVNFTVMDKLRYSGLRSFIYRIFALGTTWLGFWIILGEILIMTNWDLSFMRQWAENSSFLIF